MGARVKEKIVGVILFLADQLYIFMYFHFIKALDNVCGIIMFLVLTLIEIILFPTYSQVFFLFIVRVLQKIYIFCNIERRVQIHRKASIQYNIKNVEAMDEKKEITKRTK